MLEFLNNRVSRREALTGLGATCLSMAPFSGRSTTAQRSPTETWTGDCSLEPGIQFLLDFQAGLPVTTITELAAPPDWVPYRHRTLPLILRVPPDWRALDGWADSFSRTGAPEWVEDPPPLPQLSMFRLLAPDGDAAFEYAVGNILGKPMTPEEVAPVAIQSLLGEDPEFENVCGAVDTNPIGPSWFTTDYWEDSVFATRVFAVGLPNLLSPATTVTYTSLIGPRDDFENLAHEVFARMITQFMSGSSGNPDEEGGEG